MIEIQSLTKTYGTFKAIQNVSFSVPKGDVVGFLGPNGAGKTTTMRILCGCIGASSGEARINGMSVIEKPKDVKRGIGYLPETPPLYPNMIVQDYIEFCAAIKGVSNPKAATDKSLSLVGLQDVSHRIINNLSKGFRQRVGLAQALVHEPSVLVLDEPTSGLDPAQRIELRKLLKELSQGDITVILSTHILGEVESICNRAIIISRGEIVAQDTLSNLKSMENRIKLHVASGVDQLLPQFEAHPAINQVFDKGNGLIELEYNQEIRAEVAKMAVEYGILELSPASKLEDVYLRLTQGKV
ncbi:MAG: ABC transporter ATP-binding protein [Myxococcota bacterium]|nr:ABC transporter ATP-binding protein [Myxococcota bacterium]